MNSFNQSIDLLHRALDVNALRYQVTANNIANAEVPNFKRSSVNFESELKQIIINIKNHKNIIAIQRMNIIKIQMQYRLLSQLENFEFSQVKTAMSPNR